MLKKDFWVHSCYKLMFWLGVYDTLATFIGGTLMGIFTLRGDIFCTNEDFLYLSSCFTATFWTAACMTGLLLMFNRFLDLIKKEYANVIFGGKKTYFWLILPFVYGAYFCIFTKPFLINSKLDSLFVNPFVTEPDIMKMIDPKDYINDAITYHNLSVAAIFPILYILLCVVLLWKTKAGGSQSVSTVQKQIIGQSVIISVFLVIAGVMFVYMQFFYVPQWLIIFSHFTWQACHGASVFTYIVVNRSMKNEAFSMLKKFITAGRYNRARSGATVDYMTSYPTGYTPRGAVGVDTNFPTMPAPPCVNTSSQNVSNQTSSRNIIND